MRTYLADFLKEYAPADAEVLLHAYDRISATPAGKTLLDEALSAYRADKDLDYKAEILERSKRIAQITALHPYTVDLLIFICMTEHLKTLYLAQGIDLQIFHDSVLDLKWKLEECKAVKGICGSFVVHWFPGFFNLTRFALGRLQFELVTMKADYRKNGYDLKAGISKAINVHIPRTGTPMDKESCDRAYAAARAFFYRRTGQRYPFVCHSWLLYPENRQILPTHTNTYRFLSEYEILDWGYNDGKDLWRLFDTEEKDPHKLPTNGTLRRAYAEHLKKGGKVGWGYGIKMETQCDARK